MPHTIGTKIKQHAKQRTVFSLVDIKLYAFQLLRAVAFMHSRDIAHRDIKPQNVLIDPTTGALRLCDFGAAK
jgi:glycogen synthase kinase 3 beta